MSKKDALCEFARVACEVWSLGYSQGPTRWNVWDGGECDCASLAITAAKQAGYDVGNASYTGDMIQNLTARGWQVLPYSWAEVRRGDMVIKPKTASQSGHVAICIDENNNGNKIIAEAYSNEWGSAMGGQPGDQTGRETRCTVLYNFATHILRPPSEGEQVGTPLYIICGHGAGDPGAGGNGYNEAERVRALGGKIAELGGSMVHLLDTSRNWYADNGISSLSIPNNAALVELHMDSSDSPSARGGHVIISSRFDPDEYDTRLAALMARLFPGRANTIVKRSDLANVNRSASRGINYRLVENGFITNADDMRTFNSRLDELALGYLQAFGIQTQKEEPKPQPKPKPVPVPKREPGGEIAMRTIQDSLYRIYNPYSGDHLLTTDKGERDALIKDGWTLDKTDFDNTLGEMPQNVAVVYRLYNVDTGEHFFTADYDEASSLVKQTANMSDGTRHGWQSEGEPFVAYKAYTPDKIPVYRLYNPASGFHLFTVDNKEVEALKAQGYENEGVAFCTDA